MTKLDSWDAVLTWMETVLTEIVKGIRGTFLYWKHREDELSDLVKE